MPRTFAYVRVSTTGQTADNQLHEIAAAGFAIEPRRVVTETISGSVATAQRRGFTRLLDRLEAGDVLVVTKLDRLGRNAMDVGSTVAKLAVMGVRVHCLALGGVDLASSTGKLTMNVINAVAEFERDLLIERTQAGLIRAKAGWCPSRWCKFQGGHHWDFGHAAIGLRSAGEALSSRAATPAMVSRVR
jgi:putative DNA-invertase from lambdoid prophage Rac